MLLVLSCTSTSFLSLSSLSLPSLLSGLPLSPLSSLLRSPLVTPYLPLISRNRQAMPSDRQTLTTRTLSRFHGEDIYVSSLFHGVGIFLFSFAGSMFLGVAFGLCCSLGLKHSHLASYPHIESCIVALVAYTSYFFSNGLSMSGESFLLYSFPDMDGDAR
jgi:sodium/hydrogen exchanger-like protein 6/7